MFLLFMKHDPDNLNHLLQEWNEMPVPDGRLAGPVWERIKAVQGRASWFDGLLMRLRELDVRFARPQTLAAVVAFSLLIGFGFAAFHTRYNAKQMDAEMSARYLSMLDVSRR